MVRSHARNAYLLSHPLLLPFAARQPELAGRAHQRARRLLQCLHRRAVGGQRQPEGYTTLLGLISHEYFHTWNIKRLRPAEFTTFDYAQENYTRLLWFFEGFTSYYDDLLLSWADSMYAGSGLGEPARAGAALSLGAPVTRASLRSAGSGGPDRPRLAIPLPDAHPPLRQ